MKSDAFTSDKWIVILVWDIIDILSSQMVFYFYCIFLKIILPVCQTYLELDLLNYDFKRQKRLKIYGILIDLSLPADDNYDDEENWRYSINWISALAPKPSLETQRLDLKEFDAIIEEDTTSFVIDTSVFRPEIEYFDVIQLNAIIEGYDNTSVVLATSDLNKN
ncbi:uncharacterized protein LOC143190577 [Rhynchophorus ferrugineus]|uniref:uncharacterized protein LOC143190577 n=1 Tax=Rhynchophorus ferrugineus TaxID=354439 RepID=UPI003FCD6F70